MYGRAAAAARVRSIFRVCSRKYYNNIKNMEHVALSQTGDSMPTVGLGTWQAPPDVIVPTVYKALELGYRHIDTAFNYNNEEAIGVAVKKWIEAEKGDRQELFITTKLPHVGNRASDVRKFLKLQLDRLQMDYVDLYLIHVPFGFHCNQDTLTPEVKENGDYVLDIETDHETTWKAMEECVKDGLVRNLGVSNFNENQIQKIIDAALIRPQVLQVELHAYFQQEQLRRFCKEWDIVVTAYAPLGSPGAKDHFVNKYNYSPEAFPDLLGHPVVGAISKDRSRTPAQVLLNYLVQEGVVVIPKSTSETRLKSPMPLLTNAKRMKRYREKLKKDPDRYSNYVKKQAKLVKEKTKKNDELSEEEKAKKRQKWREQKRKQKNKQGLAVNNIPIPPSNSIIRPAR